MTEVASTEDPVVDDAWNAARGTRSAARWMAGALGAIPGLAVVTAVVRNPGDNGFDHGYLLLGIGLAAGGAALCVGFLAWVFAPIPLEDGKLKGFDMTRIRGNPGWTKFQQLADELSQTSGEIGTLEYELSDPGAAKVEERKKELEWKKLQLTRLQALRSQVYQLQSSDKVRKRFNWALGFSAVGVALIAAGIYFIGVAPITTPPTADSASLLKLNLASDTAKALGCNRNEIQGLKVAESDSGEQTIVTFSYDGCPAMTLTIKPGETTTDVTKNGEVVLNQKSVVKITQLRPTPLPPTSDPPSS